METVKINGQLYPKNRIKVKIVNDPHQEPPYANDDGFPPILIRGSRFHNYDEGEEIIELINSLQWPKEEKPLNTVLALLGLDHIEGKLSDHINETTSLQLLETILLECGYVARKVNHKGLSQSDWIDVLYVITPEYIERTGVQNEIEVLQSSAKEMEAYTQGECYGYQIIYNNTIIIEDPYLEENPEIKYSKELDSCYGFLGEPKESGMLDYIPEELHEQINYSQITEI